MFDTILFDIFVISICLTGMGINLYAIYSHKRLLLFPITNILMIVSNFIGIPFIKYLDKDLNFLGDQYLNEIACYVMIIFLSLSTASLCLIYPLLISKKDPGLIPQFTFEKKILFYLILCISIYFFINFFLFSRGYDYLGKIFTFGTNFESYYVNRVIVGKELSQLNGANQAFLLTTFINPSLISILVIEAKKIKCLSTLNKSLLIYLFSSLLIISIIFAKRFSIVFATIFPLILLIYYRKHKNKNRSSSFHRFLFKFRHFFANKNYFILAMFLMIIFTTFSGRGLLNSSFDILNRTIGVPAATNNYYYYIFPKIYNFRGIEKIGKMGTDGSNQDISYQDIGEATTGQRFVPNANFVTIAYSGAGYYGVAIASIIYCLLCIFHDFFVSNLDIDLSNICLITNIYGFYAVVSAPLQVAIFSYGFIISTLLIIISIKIKKMR